MPFPTNHALLIGTGSYIHAPQLNILITVADAQSVLAASQSLRAYNELSA